MMWSLGSASSRLKVNNSALTGEQKDHKSKYGFIAANGFISSLDQSILHVIRKRSEDRAQLE